MKEAKRQEQGERKRRQYQPPTMLEFGPILKLTQGSR
jgi:hypothetical protein